MLERLLTSKSRVALLTIFFAHPAESFHVRQLERLSGQSFSNVRRELKNLEELGLVQSERRANARYYGVNSRHFLYPDLKNIVLKTEGVGELLRSSLTDAGQVRLAFIYGSIAKGTERLTSDIDLMVVGDVPLERLDDAMDEMERRLGRQVNYTVYGEAEWQRKIAEHDPFISRVLAGKRITLIGEADELRTTGAGQAD